MTTEQNEMLKRVDASLERLGRRTERLIDALTTEREVRKQLVEALEGLEGGWVKREPRITISRDGRSWDFICTVCDYDLGGTPRDADCHQSGCPVPPAYAALEAARALDEVKA